MIVITNAKTKKCCTRIIVSIAAGAAKAFLRNLNYIEKDFRW